jgi:hypothetical protein
MEQENNSQTSSMNVKTPVFGQVYQIPFFWCAHIDAWMGKNENGQKTTNVYKAMAVMQPKTGNLS